MTKEHSVTNPFTGEIVTYEPQQPKEETTMNKYKKATFEMAIETIEKDLQNGLKSFKRWGYTPGYVRECLAKYRLTLSKEYLSTKADLNEAKNFIEMAEPDYFYDDEYETGTLEDAYQERYY